MTATVTTATVPMPSLGENIAETPADRVEKLPRIRRTIATRMVRSLQTAAQLTTVVEAKVSSVARVRRENKDAFLSRTGHKLSYLPFFVAAAVEALADNPVVNSALAAEIASAAEKVRSGTVTADDLSGGTFTITNTGSRGALFDTPIINQPQSAILGFGSVVERVVPVRDAAGSFRQAGCPSQPGHRPSCRDSAANRRRSGGPVRGGRLRQGRRLGHRRVGRRCPRPPVPLFR
ncbi:2-oxo acid dehydrogenase subunit E2 [Rhodococcoides fascians]|uniref:2-oxo acid dehydrogenase subunit E2 n=1 Tax=Rhodococcoides fascians TaxID=1828 RepID=UPI00068AD8F3